MTSNAEIALSFHIEHAWSGVAEFYTFGGNRMTSDQDKFVKVATQELQQLHSTSSGLAANVVVPVMIVAIIIGVFLAIWIFRGGLSRSSRSTFPMGTSLEDSKD